MIQWKQNPWQIELIIMEVNRIYQKDCILGLKELPDNTVDVVFTSPPYNRKRNDKYSHYTDIREDYFQWMVEVITECMRVSKGHVFFNIMKNYYNKVDVFKLIGHFSKEIIDIHVWEKSNPMPASGNSITNAYEFFIIFGKTPLKSNTTYTKNILTTSVNKNIDKSHKAVMKLEVADHFIQKFTKEGDVILDPFMGLGTTALSAINQNRHYIGFEINEEYISIAEDRIQKKAP